MIDFSRLDRERWIAYGCGSYVGIAQADFARAEAARSQRRPVISLLMSAHAVRDPHAVFRAAARFRVRPSGARRAMRRLLLRSRSCSIHEAQVSSREVDRRNCLSSCSAKKPMVLRSTRNAHPCFRVRLDCLRPRSPMARESRSEELPPSLGQRLG